jgi:hypothetical protein
MVFWLVLATSLNSTPLHVGNYPTLAACQSAATSAWTTIKAAYVCVQANTAKQGTRRLRPNS